MRTAVPVLPSTARTLALFTVLTAVIAALLLPAAPAHAAARVQVSSELGGAKASLTAPTRVDLAGTGFQSIQGGFGGIYVLFGWISSGDSWRPSNGGMTGSDYRYVPDSETKDNQGYQRFVTFPGSSTAGAANGGELRADGTWNAQMIIPGPVFDSIDRDGSVQRVDCRELQCGIITVGAHGVKNPSNETFTPIEFVGSGGAESAGGSAPAAGGSSDAGAQGAQNPQAVDASGASEPGTAADAPVAENAEVGAEEAGVEANTEEVAHAGAGEPTIGLLSKELEQGSVVSFTAQGFSPGEQVVATLDLGSSAAGPYQAGQFGDVAGTVPLAGDIRPGTHVLTLSGAGSGALARVSFTVAEPPVAPVAGAIGDSDLTWWTLAVLIGFALALLVLLILMVSAITALLRRRKHARAAATDEFEDPEEPEESSYEPGRGLRATLGMLVLAGVAASALTLGPSTSAFADDNTVDIGVQIPETDPTAGLVDNAVFSWGLNEETGGGAYYGGCNFLVAGQVGDIGSSHVWSAAEGAAHYRATAGDVSIVHPRDNGTPVSPTWETKCQDAEGSAVTTQPGSSTYNTAVFTGGTGEYDAAAGTATVAWDGSATVVFYGGMTYWTFSDPTLTVTSNGAGTVTAQATGYGADMFDASKWVKLDTYQITLATLSGVDVTNEGIVTTPDYHGVSVDVDAGGPSSPQRRDLEGWGSFPQSFVDFQVLTGQTAYWYTSGGLADAKKATSPMVVSWDAARPVSEVLPGGGTSGSAAPVGAVPVSADGPGGATVGPGGVLGSSVPFAPGVVAQPIPPSAASGDVVAPALLEGDGALATPASATGFLSPDWIGGELIPAAADAAFGTPARAAISFAVAGGLSALLWLGLRRKWFAIPFLDPK